MQNAFELENRLGFRILLWTLAIALITGIVVSAAQVALDGRAVSRHLEDDARETIATIRDAATQAVFSIDSELARQVVDGLFGQDAVHMTQITHPDGQVLAYRSRPLSESVFRPLTDSIFGRERHFRTPLVRSAEPGTVYGFLDIHYDTAPFAREWLSRALITFASVVATAVILGLLLFIVFHLLLTQPLLRIVQSVKQVDPDRPDDRLLPLPPGHEQDELGLWVNATNNLLVAIGESQKRHREAEDRVSRLSRYDQLTGLPSRETFMDLLRDSIREALSRNSLLALSVLGVDDFKSINEQYGFRTGDLLLQTLADRLTGILGRSRFAIARLGSDQFVILEKELRNDYEAANTAERILSALNSPVTLADKTIRTSATMGIALCPADADQADRLLQNAEQAMALAKSKGRNHFQFYVASIDQEIRNRKLLEKDLSTALQNHELYLVYQPQVNLETHRIIGAEALIRWQHPERGLVAPDHFIPVAETNGSIVEIGQWVLEQACWQASRWAAEGLGLRIAVNLSAVQLRQDTIVEDILGTLARHQIPAGRMELEVTETSFMTNLGDRVEVSRRHGTAAQGS